MIRFLQIALLTGAVAPTLGTDGHTICRFPMTATPSTDSVVLAQVLPVQNVPQEMPSDRLIQINYDGVPLADFVRAVGPMLSFPSIQIDPDVHGSVTIRTTAPMSQESLRRLFEGVLYNNGAALRKSGDSYRVVTLASIGMLDRSGLPTPEPPKREPIPVNGDTQKSKLICRVEPVYPEKAKRARVSGMSLLEVTINEQGEVSKVRVIRSGHPLVLGAVIEAVKLWRYSPTFIDGLAVPVIATVIVPFNLQ